MTFTRRTISLIVAALVLSFVGLRLWTSAPAPAPGKTTSVPSSTPGPESGSPQAAATPLQAPRGNLVSYAVAVSELRGLPPDAAPGTRLEIWVAWEPPITKQPDIRPLLDDVLLEEISPPLLPDGPHVASLLVRRGQISDLFYGDRYGSLSVVVPQAAAADPD